MQFKIDFDETTYLALESSIILKKILNICKSLISCMVAMVTRIKFFKTSPLSYIVATPYFYFMILKIMSSYTKHPWIINSLGQKLILF